VNGGPTAPTHSNSTHDFRYVQAPHAARRSTPIARAVSRSTIRNSILNGAHTAAQTERCTFPSSGDRFRPSCSPDSRLRSALVQGCGLGAADQIRSDRRTVDRSSMRYCPLHEAIGRQPQVQKLTAAAT
jgi:hypothetical protein